MQKFMSKLKGNLKGVRWPNTKEIVGDTMMTVIVTILLSLLILAWQTGIDFVVDWVISLF